MARLTRRALAAATLILAACGGGDAGEDEGAGAAPPAARPAPAPVDTLPVDTATAPIDSVDGRTAGAPDVGRTGAAGSTESGAAPARAGSAGPARYTVQVGAFVREGAAEALAGRLRDQGVPVWRSDATVAGRSFHRVRVGAVTTAAEARALRDRLARSYRLPAWLAPLTPSERADLPAAAVAATRSYIRAEA